VHYPDGLRDILAPDCSLVPLTPFTSNTILEILRRRFALEKNPFFAFLHTQRIFFEMSKVHAWGSFLNVDILKKRQ